MKKTYEIGEKTYHQERLVYGQIRQLLAVMEGIVIPANPDAATVIQALGGKLHEALAVVLTPAGGDIRNKDVAALAAEIEFDLYPEQIFDVVTDFFECNLDASLWEKLRGMAPQLRAVMEKTGLKKLSASLPVETSPGVEASSGDALQMTPPPTFGTGKEKPSSVKR